MDLFKEEQDRLLRELALADGRLEVLYTEYDTARTQLQECLALGGDDEAPYSGP